MRVSTISASRSCGSSRGLFNTHVALIMRDKGTILPESPATSNGDPITMLKHLGILTGLLRHTDPECPPAQKSDCGPQCNARVSDLTSKEW